MMSGSRPLGKNSLPSDAISKKPSSSGSGTPSDRAQGIMAWMFQVSDELTVACRMLQSSWCMMTCAPEAALIRLARPL